MAPQTDLAANRLGQIADSQRDEVRTGARIGRRVFRPIMFAILAVLYGLQFSPWTAAVVAATAAVWAASHIASIVTASRRTLRELAAGVVAHDHGTVAWRGAHYVATIEGQTRIEINDVTLAPGQYLFHYLPQSGRILSAESQSRTIEVERAISHALAEAFPFTARALAMNRQGRVAASQFLAMASPYAGNIAVTLACFVTLGIRLVYFPEEQGLGMTSGQVLVSVLAGAGLLACWRLIGDGIARRVRTIDGAAICTVKTGGTARNSVRYFVHIGDRKFDVSEGAYRAVVEGVNYRGYMLPFTRVLVAIEPLDLVGAPVDSLQP
jgi:hypothetical protein